MTTEPKCEEDEVSRLKSLEFSPAASFLIMFSFIIVN